MQQHFEDHGWAYSRRRQFLRLVAGASCLGGINAACDASATTLNFGLTPVFPTNDLELLTKLRAYLSRKTGRDVQLVQRRTCEEITNLLLSGELTAAWICGYPLVQYPEQLGLLAVPLRN